MPYVCPICHLLIAVEARGGPHPSPGDHDPAYHVAKAYGTSHPLRPSEAWYPEEPHPERIKFYET